MSIDARSYAIAFLLTLLLEVAVALVLGYRKRSEIVCVVAVNVFSHPLLVYLLCVIGSLRSAPISPLEILLFEAGVVLVEWQLLRFALPRQSKSQLFFLSLVMNGVSYISGIVFIPPGV